MVQNIRFLNPNMTRVGAYFYSFNEETDIMIQKADDGTLAFSYPLDTTIPYEVSSLEYDGESYWTMENFSGTPAEGFRIRRWIIDNFVMVLQDTFSFETDSNDTFEADAFTIEHYEGTITSGASAGSSNFTVAFDTDIFNLITPGTRMFIGPSTVGGYVGESETVTVGSTVGTNEINISSPLTNSYIADNPVIFMKNLWVFNKHYLKTLDVGALYKISSLDGSILSRDSGGAYKDIKAATFHELDSFTGSLAVYNKPYLVFIRTTNLLFVDINDSNLPIELSAVQNNLSVDTTEVFDVYDMGIVGDTIFRLQEKFNINGSETTHAYNYQLATFRPFPTAIAITATPAILPADPGGASSLIEATVTDQYALPYDTDPSATIQFSTTGGGAGSGLSNTGQIALDGNGQAEVTYTTGDTAGLVTISAVVTINT
jgi:hypothetical protein